MGKPLTIAELAARINAKLQKFEADPKINKPLPTKDSASLGTQGLSPYYNARAVAVGGRVCVSYVSFQGNTYLNHNEARYYWDWLSQGSIGTHYDLMALSGWSWWDENIKQAPSRKLYARAEGYRKGLTKAERENLEASINIPKPLPKAPPPK